MKGTCQVTNERIEKCTLSFIVDSGITAISGRCIYIAASRFYEIKSHLQSTASRDPLNNLLHKWHKHLTPMCDSGEANQTIWPHQSGLQASRTYGGDPSDSCMQLQTWLNTSKA